MWFIVLLVAVSVLLILAARRRSTDGRDSVDSQRLRLDALRTAVSRTDLAASRTSTSAARAFGSIRSGRRSRWSSPLASKPVLLVAATALVLAAVVGLMNEAISSQGGTDGTPAHEATSRPGSRAPTTASTTTSTSTTAPPSAAILRAQGGVITISVPVGAYRLTLTAHGSCWVRAQRPDGTVVDTTTLHTGDSRELAASGPLTIRLGNPGVVDVAVDAHVLALPVQNGAAVDLKFAPAG